MKNIRVLVLIACVVAPIFLIVGVFANGKIVNGKVDVVKVSIQPSDGVSAIANKLRDVGLIHSKLFFLSYGLLSGNAWKLKPGNYKIPTPTTIRALYATLVAGPHRVVSVTIPEGSNIYDIGDILDSAQVLDADDFIAYAQDHHLEGMLFPDTYFLFTDATVQEVVEKFQSNFIQKTKELLPSNPTAVNRILTIASLLENEVRSSVDQKLVAGIIEKRLSVGMPLQLDASICYLKQQDQKNYQGHCYPLTPLDFKIKSPYNTYLQRQLPPGPIGNPGLSAISAALHPTPSAYWFYLSDPQTQKTIFSKTFTEHVQNRHQYLGS